MRGIDRMVAARVKEPIGPELMVPFNDWLHSDGGAAERIQTHSR
jgi:hypothetical protein